MVRKYHTPLGSKLFGTHLGHAVLETTNLTPPCRLSIALHLRRDLAAPAMHIVIESEVF
jgi:hypothetical protein